MPYARIGDAIEAGPAPDPVELSLGPERFPRPWIFAALFVVVLLAYFPSLQGGLLWDDAGHVTAPSERTLGGLSRIWFDLRAAHQYYPLLHSAFWIEHRLWGDSVLGYHLVNVFLHAGSAYLVGLILRRLAGPGAWFAAAIFALHPVNVESVAWICEQKNTLSTFLYLAAGLSYLRFAERRDRVSYALSSVLFGCALLSKTVTVTLPAALLVVFWWRRGRLEWKRDVTPLLPWFAASMVSGLVTSWVERHGVGAQGVEFELTLGERVLVAAHAVWFYVVKLLCPVDLVPIYPRWNLRETAGYIALGASAVAAAAFAFLAVRRKWRGPLAAGLFFVGSLFPVLGFFNVFYFQFSFVADHWVYVPAIGIIAGLAAIATRWAERQPVSRRWLSHASGAALLVVLGLLTAWQCRFYRDAETFYRRILAYNTNAWIVHNNLAGVLMAAGRTEQSLSYFREALQLKPDYEDARFNLALAEANLGGALFKQGKYQEAAPHLEAAVHSGVLTGSSGYVQLLADWSTVLMRAGRFAEGRNAQGLALIHAGREAEAAQAFTDALNLEPDFAEAQVNLGTWLAQHQRFEEAVPHFERGLRATPNWPEAQSNLAAVFLQLGRWDEAIARYRKALELLPADPSIRVSLALAFAQAGRMAEAIAQCEEAVRRAPNDPTAPKYLAELRAGRKALPEGK